MAKDTPVQGIALGSALGCSSVTNIEGAKAYLTVITKECEKTARLICQVGGQIGKWARA